MDTHLSFISNETIIIIPLPTMLNEQAPSTYNHYYPMFGPQLSWISFINSIQQQQQQQPQRKQKQHSGPQSIQQQHPLFSLPYSANNTVYSIIILISNHHTHLYQHTAISHQQTRLVQNSNQKTNNFPLSPHTLLNNIPPWTSSHSPYLLLLALDWMIWLVKFSKGVSPQMGKERDL